MSEKIYFSFSMVLQLFYLYYSMFISIFINIYKEILLPSDDVLNVILAEFYPM